MIFSRRNLEGSRERLDGQLCNQLSKKHWYSFLNKAVSRRCYPSVWMVTLLLHAISIIRTGVRTVYTCRPNGCKSSPHLALSRIASGRCRPFVRTIAAVFPYLCLRRTSFYLSNIKWRPDMLLRRPNGCNLEQFESSRHWWESGRNNYVVRKDVAWLMSVQTIERDVRTESWDPTSLTWNLCKIYFEAHLWIEDSEFNGILN
jgi:hypothetical protein